MLSWGCKTLFLVIFIMGCSMVVGAEEFQDLAKTSLPQGALQAEELVALFSNKTVYSVTAEAERESVSYYAPSGEIRQKRNGITRYGRWRVTDNHRICLQMEDLPEKCRIVVKENGGYRKYIVHKSGQHQHSVSYPRFEQGNPLGL